MRLKRKKVYFMHKKFILFIVLVGLLTGCRNQNPQEEKIAGIPVSFTIERFDKKFARATPEDLPELKTEYPFLFPTQFADSVWIDKMTDSLQVKLHQEVEDRFPDLDTQKTRLHGLFQHLKFYFSDFEVPRVIALTNNVDYRHRVIVTDSLLLISLDNYLGADHRFYSGIYQYLTKDFIPTQIVPDIAKAYAEEYVPRPKDRGFLINMIYYGKIRYLMRQLLPQRSEADLMGYTDKQLKWAQANERHIWGYFIENRILYKTDPELQKDFFNIGPFTKFGLQLDSKSPPQLGQWMGLQIVKQYAERHEEIKLSQLLMLDNLSLFEKSNYKPKQN